MSTVGAYLGGPSPSRKDDPALRFDSRGVEYHQSYGGGPTTRLEWKDIRAVAIVPGPVLGREALCVYPVQELPDPDLAVEQRWTGSGKALWFSFKGLFDTPIAVHWHHVRGPSMNKLARQLPILTERQIFLTYARPATGSGTAGSGP